MLIVILSLLIGLTLALLGGGGSILMLPMLVYIADFAAKPAIASSLLVIGTTSLVGIVAHARAGRVRWKVGALFGLAGMVGGYGGGRLAHFVPGSVLLIAFAVMMLVTSVAMLRGRKEPAAGVAHQLSLPKAIALGTTVGLVAGLVGAGGGFLVVPALVLFGGLAMPEAIATSLLVISMQSLAAFAGHISTTQLNWNLLAIVTGASVVGSLIGVRLVKHVQPAVLRKMFGWLVLVMGMFLLIKQVPSTHVRTLLLGALAGGTGLALIQAAWKKLEGYNHKHPTHHDPTLGGTHSA
jgi:uncharacterized protein